MSAPIIVAVMTLLSASPAAPAAAAPTPPIAHFAQGAPVAPVAPVTPVAPGADDAADALARLAALRQDARNPSLSLEARRGAAESLIAASRALIDARPRDLRAGRWLADTAEECYVTVLPLGGDLDSALAGLPSHEEWRRVSATVATMLDCSERAERASKDAVARLSDPAHPLDAEVLALLDAYETIELERRIPLLRGIAEVLAAVTIDGDAASRRARGTAALARLEPLLDQLDDDALLHAACAATLAAALAGNDFAMTRANDVARSVDARDAAQRAGFAAALGAALAGRWPDAIRRADELRAHAPRSDAAETAVRSPAPRDAHPAAAESVEFAQRRAFLEARLRRDASLAGSALDGEHWTTPLLLVPGEVPPRDRSHARVSVLARLADMAESDLDAMRGSPLADLAAAETLLRRERAESQALARIDAALAALAAPGAKDSAASWRPVAFEQAARVHARRGESELCADRLLDAASEARADPDFARSIDRAAEAARALDDGVPGSPARRRLERVVALVTARFPDHPEHGRYRAEQGLLELEAAAAAVPTRATSMDEERAQIGAVRRLLALLPSDERSRDLRTRLALASATIALASLAADDALLALESASAPSEAPRHANSLRDRWILTLALLDRDVARHPFIERTSAAERAALVSATASALARVAPPLAPCEPALQDGRRRAAVQRLVALLDWLAPAAGPSPGRAAAELAAAQSLHAVGLDAAALPRVRALRAAAPDRGDLILAEAECLMSLPREAALEHERLAAALDLYERLLRGAEYSQDPVRRTPSWWLCHLRALECIARSGGEPDRSERQARHDRIAARVERLRLLDPALGGEPFSRRFADLVKSSAESFRAGEDAHR